MSSKRPLSESDYATMPDQPDQNGASIPKKAREAMSPWEEEVSSLIESADAEGCKRIECKLNALLARARESIEDTEAEDRVEGLAYDGEDAVECSCGNAFDPDGEYGSNCILCESEEKEVEICIECAYTCANCEEAWLCEECVGTCASCEELCCKECLKECEQCSEKSCEGCFVPVGDDEDDQVCKNCHEATEDPEEDDEPTGKGSNVEEYEVD